MKEEKVDKIFTRCEEINVELDPNPIQRGPNYLNKMVAECRNHTTEIQEYKREVIQKKLKVERKLNRKKTEHELKFNDLMANDERVVERSSKSDREAKANDILEDLNSEIKELESELTDLKHVESIIESKLRELRDVNRDIRLQKRLIEDEIDTGSFWGQDNSDEAGEKVNKKEADFDMSELVEEEEEGTEEKEEDYEDLFGSDSDESEEDFEEAFEEMDTDGVTKEEETTIDEEFFP